MKAILILTAAVLGTALCIASAHGETAGQKPAKRAEHQTLRAEIQTFRVACRNGDVPGAKAAMKSIVQDWKTLPHADRERILKNHPQLADRIDAWKQAPEELRDLKADVKAAKDAKQSGDEAAMKQAAQKAVSDFKELPPALKKLIVKSHPKLAEAIRERR